MKKIQAVAGLLLLLSLLTACTRAAEDEFFIFSTSYSERLTDCLDEQSIPYELDSHRNILIQHKDNDHAVLTCA